MVDRKRGSAIPPYLPTPGWYAAFMRSGGDIASANSRLGISGKDFVRAAIRGQLLSAAVEGGSGRLKGRHDVSGIRLSDHGNWPHVHLGALEARYGRAPYYQYVMPGLRRILDNPPETLAELNMRLHRHVMTFLTAFPSDLPPGARERAGELKESADPALSIIDTLMNLGPETSLLLYNLSESL